jgi:UDP-N-acetylmuramyl pentapeptide phosphotransferase/UDP-N-acetylglucosamine-1-phosphate transferase
MIAAAWAALAATVAAAVGDLVNRRIAGWLPDDPPHPGRKQHARPMPLAGIVVVPAIAPWLVAERAWWPLAAMLVAATVGFVDDGRKETGNGLDWRWKALGLALASGLAATAVVRPEHDPLTWLGVAAFVFVLTNATNFLDNTDGVATSLSAVSLLVLGQGSNWTLAAGFAALGFLPWNWPRPRLFLGDGGAYALGALAGIASASAARHDPRALLAVAVQLADFVQVVLARVWLAVPPWVGDRRHLTHIVQNLGLPRVLVAPLFAAIAMVLAQRMFA